jgi:glycosyltransferase involved in cell wall biosynthesis
VKQKLSIALFSDSALPILNGVSVSIAALIEEFRRQGHSVHLFTSGYPRYKETDPNTHRFYSAITPFAPDYPFAFPPFAPFLREFCEAKFDIVHTHTPFTVGCIGLAWAKLQEIPIVSTYHTQYDKYTHYVPIIPKKIVRRIIARHTTRYYNSVDHVLTPSHSSLRWLEKHKVVTPLTIVPTGVPPARQLNRSECRARLKIDPNDSVLLYAGRIATEKNLELIFQAFKIVIEKEKHAQLLIVGDGPANKKYLELARSLGVGDCVKFVGFVPRENLDPFYAAADVFVFPSMTETQGLVVAEAMSYGLPPVVVRYGGAGEQVEDNVNGFLCANDPAEMASDILNLLSDNRTYKRLASEAIQTAERLSIPDMAANILTVYREVIRGHTTRHR